MMLLQVTLDAEVASDNGAVAAPEAEAEEK
jgi:hypothetical protein